MAGANYMGGKRNAVRARTKDVITRIQKGHFGKQRLNLLAHGVVRNSAHPLKQSHKTASIDLAHARRDYSTREQPTRSSFLPPATSKNLDSHGSALFYQSPISRFKPSKLLTALEKLEPISFSSKKNRLLKISDFAGLTPRLAEATLRADTATVVQFPVRKRKVDDSDLFSRDVGKKRKLLLASSAIHGSSSSDLPPSPSPAFPSNLSVPRSSSSIHSFQASAGCSEISSGDQVSVASPPNSTHEDFFCSSHQERWPEARPILQCKYKLEKRYRDSESFSGQIHTWKTSEILAHPPSENFSAELFEMSKEWCEMAVYLRLDDYQRQQPISPQRNTRALGRLGVDFYVFPHLKPLGIRRSPVNRSTATDSNLQNDPSDLSSPRSTPVQSDVPKPQESEGDILYPSADHEAWEEHKSNDIPVDLLAPSPAVSLLPLNIRSPSMEPLVYDTQPISQQLPIYAGHPSQLPSDHSLVIPSVSAPTPPPSANTNIFNDNPSFIPEEPSHNIPMSQDYRNPDVADPLIDSEDLNQSTNHCTPPSDSLTSGSLTEGSHSAPHGLMPEEIYLAGSINVNSAARPLECLEDLQQGDVTSEPRGSAGSFSRNVKTGPTSIDVNDKDIFIATTNSAPPSEDVATAGNAAHTPVSENDTDHVQIDISGSNSLIEGPLLFAFDDEEIGDED